MQPPMADGRHQQLGQICYVPLYIVPQGTAGGPSVDMASLQSCAAAMAAAQSSAGIATATAAQGGASAQPQAQFSFSPFLVQLPVPPAASSSAPSSPGTSSSSPASPGQIHAQHQHQQAQLAQLAQHYAALQHQHQQQQPRAPVVGTQPAPAAASGLAEYRLSNFASLLPAAAGSAPQPQQQPQGQQPGQLASPFVVPSLAALPHLAAAAAGAHQQAHYAFPFQLQGSALFAAPPPTAVAEASSSTCTTPSSDPALVGGSSCAALGKKEIKFKYHMSIMPQLATSSGAPAPPKVEMKKKRKPRMRITGRVCTHCGATKTTEWRMGPEGRGTLCNACGLRYRKKLLMDGQKDPNAKITMSMLLNATKKTTKPGGSSSSAKDEGPSSSPSRRSDDESP